MPERAMGVLIADDEKPARRRLLDLLHQEPGIASVWEATDGKMTVDLIRSCQPDLVFLDVKMPELLRFVQYSDKLEQRSLFPAGFHNGPPSLHGAESRSCS